MAELGPERDGDELDGGEEARDEAGQAEASPGAERRELIDRLARVSADYDNFKKRVRREHAETLRYANEDLARELVSVVDNLERAAASGASASAEDMARGVEMVARQLKQVLQRFGVVEIDALGQPFDPAAHEAVATGAAAGAPPDTVVEELQRGYRLHDRLLRPARVVVSTGDEERTGPH